MRITVIASTDFSGGLVRFTLFGGAICLQPKMSFWKSLFSGRVDKIPLTEIARLEIATEDSIHEKGFAGTFARGAVGGLVLGPAGLLAGAMTGGKNKKSLTFELEFLDGRGFLGECDADAYRRLQAGAYTQKKAAA
jgi:hypothetical protein